MKMSPTCAGTKRLWATTTNLHAVHEYGSTSSASDYTLSTSVVTKCSFL